MVVGEIRKLNSLRGLAALAVVVAHFSGETGWLGGYPGTGAGQLGVMLFFILSGFLMAFLYVDQPVDRRRYWRYAVARFARVVPLFAAVIIASAVLPRLGVTGLLYDLPTRPEVLSHVLLLSGKNILWTIPTELHFYVAFLAIWWIAGRSPGAAALTSAGVIALSIGFGTPRFTGEVLSIPYDLRLAQVIPFFLAGVLFAFIYRRWTFPGRQQRSVFAVALLAIPLMYPLIFEAVFGFRHGLWNDPLVLAVVTAVFGVVLFTVPDTSVVTSNRVGDFFGRISYSLYLLHVPVMRFIIDLELPNTARFVIFLAISVALSTAVFYAFERPAQRILRRRLLGEARQRRPYAMPAHRVPDIDLTTVEKSHTRRR